MLHNNINFSEIWNTIPVGIWLLDVRGKLTDANNAFLGMCECEIDDVLGDEWEQFVDPEDLSRVLEKIQKAFTEKTSTSYSFTLVSKNGRRRQVTETMYPVFIHDEFRGYFGIIDDRTIEYISEERFRRIKEIQKELLDKEKFATIGKTTAIVAHELRNPLATIRNSLYVLNSINAQNGEIREHIDRCSRSIQRCDKIIQELLDFTRTNKYKEEWFLVTDSIESALSMLEIPDGIELKTSLSEMEPITGTPNKIERAVLNIVQNAIDAIKGRGQEGKIFIGTMEKNDRIWIMIANDGPLIEEDTIEEIFEPLTSTKGFGVGLGLPVAKKMFEDHGGSLRARNLEEGVVFVGWLTPKRDNA